MEAKDLEKIFDAEAERVAEESIRLAGIPNSDLIKTLIERAFVAGAMFGLDRAEAIIASELVNKA